MASLSQLRSVLKEILDSTASLVQGRTRGGADGSTVWVDVINGRRVQAKAFGSITPGTCGVIQDKSGQWWAIGQGQGSTVTEQVQFYRHRRRAKPSKETADVAVLLSCEKDDEYDIWLTYLGDTRKNKFAFVGSMPKRVESSSYWAWESSNVGRFEFNPYAGATGGGISISSTPTNHDGAEIGASATGANYQSEGWNGGGDKGGVVTPKWTKTLTDYSVTVDTYLSTLCYPLGKYTDVTWEWSDGGGSRLKKIDGGGDGYSTKEKLGTSWAVTWSYEGGGGTVGLVQEESPRVVKKMSKPEEDIELEEGKTKVWIVEWEEGRKVFFTGEDDNLTVGIIESVSNTPVIFETTFVTPVVYETVMTGYSGPVPEEELWSIVRADSIWGAQGEFFYGSGAVFEHVRNHVAYVVIGNSVIDGSSQNWHYQNKYNYPPLWSIEVKINGSRVFTSDEYAYKPNPTVDSYSIDPEDPDPNPPPGYTYSIQVYDKDGIQVAFDSSGTPITSEIERYTTYAVGIFITRNNGTGGEAPVQERIFIVKDGEEIPGATVETNDVTAKIKGWVEIAGKKLGELELDGDEGQSIIESAAYERAIEPYKGPDGRTVYPCYVQKTEAKNSKKSFNKDDGFGLYYITHYVTEDDNGIAEWVPFDFGNPDLSGYLPSPSINFLYSLFFASIKVEYDPKGILAWGKDIPEEGSNLKEEQEDGIDTYGVVYPFAWGFIYGFYGPIKASNVLLNQTISKEDGQTLLANYNMGDWAVRARGRKPRMYAMEPDDTTSGEPFTEADITNLSQRTLNQIENTMSSSFRQGLWGTAPSSINNESEENWRSGSVRFPPPSATGQEVLNRSSVKQRGDDLKNIKVEMADVKALLKAEKKADVRFHLYPEADFTGEATTKTFKMNPIQDVFEGYDDVQIIAAAGIIY